MDFIVVVRGVVVVVVAVAVAVAVELETVCEGEACKGGALVEGIGVDPADHHGIEPGEGYTDALFHFLAAIISDQGIAG